MQFRCIRWDKEEGDLNLPLENRKNLSHLFANFMEIPKELVLKLPRVTMLGDMQLLIENHKGIIEYTSSIVRISTGSGELEISGENFVLQAINQEEIAIEGKIFALQFKD